MFKVVKALLGLGVVVVTGVLCAIGMIKVEESLTGHAYKMPGGKDYQPDIPVSDKPEDKKS
jgi:hypothetical protein